MPYTAEISRDNPSCVLFLIDQSRSMREPMIGQPDRRKADALTDALNRLLYTLVIRNVRGNGVLNRFYTGVLGYGPTTGPVLGGALANRALLPISEVARSPLRV